MKKISIVLIGPQEVILLGLQSYFLKKSDLVICSKKYDYEYEQQIINLVHSIVPDIILLDLTIRNKAFIHFCKRIKRELPNLKIIIYSLQQQIFYEKQSFLNEINAYISGNVTLEDVYTTIWLVYNKFEVSKNKIEYACENLSRYEQRVLELIALGSTNKEIALILHASERTISNYINSLYEKLHTHSRVEAALKGVLKGYLKEDIIEQILK